MRHVCTIMVLKAQICENTVFQLQLYGDTMRLVVVKPTNATRRLDSTGEGCHDRNHDHCNSGGPSPPKKTHEVMQYRYSGTALEPLTSPQEQSPCCVSAAPQARSNGVTPPRVLSQPSTLRIRSTTLSQLSNQDLLLFCNHVGNSREEQQDSTSSAEKHGTTMAHQNQVGRCDCPSLNSETARFKPRSKQGIFQDCLLGVSKKRNLSSLRSQPYPQNSLVSATCQVLSHQTNQEGHLKATTNYLQDSFMSQYNESCNQFQLKDNSLPPVLTKEPPTNVFNIPLNSVESTEPSQDMPVNKHRDQRFPPAEVERHWNGLHGKLPLLVQQLQQQDSHCQPSCDQTCKSFGDSSVVLKCRQCSDDPFTSTPRVKRSSTAASNKSVQSLATSHYSWLENHLEEKRPGQGENQVQDFSLYHSRPVEFRFPKV